MQAAHWRFDGNGPVLVSRVPPLPRALAEPINSVCGELNTTRQGMEDFLEAWRDHKRRRDPEAALVGNHCRIHITGPVVHVYPRRKRQWRAASEAWIPLVAVEEMFAAYADWAFARSAGRVEARQGGSA